MDNKGGYDQLGNKTFKFLTKFKKMMAAQTIPTTPTKGHQLVAFCLVINYVYVLQFEKTASVCLI